MQRKQNLRKKNLALGIAAVSTMLAGGTAPSVFAQDTLEEITVTGSRIVRRDLDAPSPIVTVGSEVLENSATTSVESVLNQMPQFVPSGTQFSNSIQNSATNTPGAATLNLRGMGTNRNLVLVNGKRAQPANAQLVVDINTIPSSAIQNVEVITGGASAVYGPDAMAGVVNFILKDDFEGFELDYQMGETAEGDGEEERFSMLMGVNSADGRGNIMVGIDWTKRGEVMQVDRDFFVNGWNDPGNPSGNFIGAPGLGGGGGASQAAVDALFPQVAPGTVGNSTDIYFNEDGSPFVVAGGLGYNGPLNAYTNCSDYCGMKFTNDGNLDQNGRQIDFYLSSPMERHSVFLNGTYDLTDNLTAFMQFNYSDINIDQTGGVPPAITVWQAPAIPRDGRALPDALNALLDSRANPDAPWPLFQVLAYNGNIRAENNNEVWQFQVGVEGELRDGDWTWEAYASRGDTYIEAINRRMPSLQRYQSLVYAPNFGQVAGYSPGTINGIGSGSAYSQTCTTGLPVFDKFTPSADCLDSIDSNLVNISHLTQEIMEANLQGGLGDWFELPAGEVRFAVGASYRGNTFAFQPGNPAGSILNNPIGVFSSAATGGKINVREYYGELLVPVLDTLDLELGYRYSDFSTAGGVDTYKAMFTWNAMDNLTFRGGYQLATRAPNIAELFTAPTLEVVFHPDQDNCSVTTLAPWGNVPSNPDRAKVIDLCRAIIGNNTSGFDTQTYSITGISGPEGFHRQNPPFFPLEIAIRQGNPNVGPEEGETYTFGAVITDPMGIDGLTVTADYYDISLVDAIAPTTVQTVYNNCFNWNGSTNPSYDVNHPACQRIRRNAISGDRSQVDTPFDNLGTQETQGVDLNISYSFDVGPGTLGINSNMNFLTTYEYVPGPGDPIIDAKGTLDRGGLFDFQHLTRFTYFWNDWNLGLSWRHLDSAESAAKAQSPSTTILGPGSYDIFNFNGGWNISENYSLRFGIDNLFDEDPELTNSNPAGGDTNSDQTSPGLYDLLGRRYYVGFKVNF
jgi:iron complex outermembrane receptor protein